jgi:hypothetical protein
MEDGLDEYYGHSSEMDVINFCRASYKTQQNLQACLQQPSGLKLLIIRLVMI